MGELGTPPSRITGFSRTVSSVVMALVLPLVQGGGASTRTSLAVRTDQIRGTHELQCVQGCLIVQQLPDPLLSSEEC